MLDGQNGLEAGFKVNLDPEGLTSLAAAWESTDPLHALLARLLVSWGQPAASACVRRRLCCTVFL